MIFHLCNVYYLAPLISVFLNLPCLPLICLWRLFLGSAGEVKGSEKCRYGSDLVNLIKQDFPGDFTVAVAGYPSGHPDAPSYNDDLINLKKKVEAGNYDLEYLVEIHAKYN